MLLHHCIALWLCSLVVQLLAAYLIYLVKNNYNPANQTNLNEKLYANLINVPRPMVPGPFGTLFFPPSHDSDHVMDNTLPVYGKPDDNTPQSPPSLVTILFRSPVGLYIVCSFIPLISLCLVLLCVVYSEREQNPRLRDRPGMLEAGLLQYEQLEPAVGLLQRRYFRCRSWGG